VVLCYAVPLLVGDLVEVHDGDQTTRPAHVRRVSTGPTPLSRLVTVRTLGRGAHVPLSPPVTPVGRRGRRQRAAAHVERRPHASARRGRGAPPREPQRLTGVR